MPRRSHDSDDDAVFGGQHLFATTVVVLLLHLVERPILQRCARVTALARDMGRTSSKGATAPSPHHTKVSARGPHHNKITPILLFPRPRPSPASPPKVS